MDAFPPDAIVVHIGMMKTGTTALQTLFAAARDEMNPLGVWYPGSRHLLEHHAAARSLLGLPDNGHGPGNKKAVTLDAWSDLAGRARRTSSRVLISSEHFSFAGSDQVQRLVRDLGGDRVQIVIGVRNLAAVAVSAWQETLKARWTSRLDEWLSDQFVRGTIENGAWSFWDRYDPGVVVRRWAEAARPEHVRVVIVDENDRAWLQSVFEQLLGLPTGMLAGRTPAMNNRGMTAGEAELVRRVNLAVESVDQRHHEALIRYGMIRRLVESRRPTADDTTLTLPAWASTIAADEGRRVVREIVESGVGVLGNLDNLVAGADHLTRPGSAPPNSDTVPMQAAVEAVVGVAGRAATGSWRLEAARPVDRTRRGPTRRKPTVDQLRTRELAAIVVSRAWRGLRRCAPKYLVRGGER
jgi:hypothetical protein